MTMAPRKKRTKRKKPAESISLWANQDDRERIARLRQATGLSLSHMVRTLLREYDAGRLTTDQLPPPQKAP